MRNISKLTPALIKRIIAEEKENISKQLEAEKLANKKKMLEQLRLLKKIIAKENKVKNNKLALNEMKKALVKKLKKG